MNKVFDKQGSWRKPAERKRNSVSTLYLIWIMPTEGFIPCIDLTEMPPHLFFFTLHSLYMISRNLHPVKSRLPDSFLLKFPTFLSKTLGKSLKICGEIERFWNLDLSFTDTFMADKYSKFGPTPRTPSCMQRSYLLSIDFKLEDGRHRSTKMWYCRLYHILMLQHLDALDLSSEVHLYYFHNITASYIYHIKKSEATLICPKNHRD